MFLERSGAVRRYSIFSESIEVRQMPFFSKAYSDRFQLSKFSQNDGSELPKNQLEKLIVKNY